MKREILNLLLLIICFEGFSQSFTEQEIKQINHLGINTNLYDLDDIKIHDDFSNVLKLNHRRKSNKTSGIILGSISLLTASYGVYVLTTDFGIFNGFTDRIGGVFVGVGIVSGGFSIKLFNSSKKRKKERDELIEIYE